MFHVFRLEYTFGFKYKKRPKGLYYPHTPFGYNNTKTNLFTCKYRRFFKCEPNNLVRKSKQKEIASEKGNGNEYGLMWNEYFETNILELL